MQTLRKKTSPCKYKNEPSRFLGEGVSFKAKLIGILEVNEARGDRMCQEALADLKMAIRAAGEHKQRININIAIDGLRLRDEKTGDCLYHHPVHKISFIAQDMSDSRAFGYIFGSPDTGHRFFGIKTDKAASQVVIAMRDLFQVVFELKKKEIELAKQHIEQHQIKLGGGLFGDGSNSKNGAGSLEQGGTKMRPIQEDSTKENGAASSTKSAQQTSEVIADLLDLEFELNSIQQGIHQMERITPSDPFGPSSTREDPFGSDPFGDSFAPSSTVVVPPKSTKQPVAILPPPPSAKDSGRSLTDPFNVPATTRTTGRRSATRTAPADHFTAPTPSTTKPATVQTTSVQQQKHWFDQETESLFDEGELITSPLSSNVTIPSYPTIPAVSEQEEKEPSKSPTAQKNDKQFDVFTELDPLGTGRSKPYIDRKDFFQELKNPPKKVLKDLVTEAPSEATAPLFQANFDKGSNNLTTKDSEPTQSSDNIVIPPSDTPNATVGTITTSNLTSIPAKKALVLDVDPFEDTDPFDKTDPFTDNDFPPVTSFPSFGSSSDPFDTGFADFTMFGKSKKSDLFPGGSTTALKPNLEMKRTSPLLASESMTTQTFHGPLRVSLPPEKSEPEIPITAISANSMAATNTESASDGTLKTRSKTSRLSKQTTLSTMVKLPSPKSSQRSSSKLMKQMTVDACTTVSGSRPVRLSPTPPMVMTPSKSERKSPIGQGILETVTLRNRSSVTPSPPVVASFPESGDGDNTSRLSGSSAELAEIAPEPPPRPAASIAAIKPPPLPPKRQHISTIMKPPPRPPHIDEQPHYDYIENYETSSSPTQHEIDVLQSPPLPVPARRPKFPEVDIIPQRPRRQPLSSKLSTSSDSDYLTPFPLLPPPQKKSPGADPSKVHHPSKPRTPVMTTIDSFLMSTASLTTTSASDDKKKKPTNSLNITLSQLTKTGLQDLATALGVSPGHLSNMTLQELTNCLSKLSAEAQSVDSNTDEVKTETDTIKRDKYATLRESVDDEPEFKAEFEANFEEKLEDVFQEAPFDKYAVFRELIEEVKNNDQSKDKPDFPLKEEEKTSELLKKETTSETASREAALRKEAQDKYAALREISIEETGVEKEDVDTSSDKEDSVAEVPKADEEDDLLTLSRQQSESTESPTVDVITLHEPQSIIETTILEEDANALEADNEDDIPEKLHDTIKSVIESPLSKTLNEKEMTEEIDENNGSSLSEKDDDFSKAQAISAKDESENDILSTDEGWAKFDSIVPEKKPHDVKNDEAVSPWSSDSKELGRIPTSYHDTSDQEQDLERRRRVRTQPQWQEDNESEEGWDEHRPDNIPWPEKQWRENGWSDGESYYDDVPQRKERIYHEDRMGRRRRVTAWKSSQRTSRDPSPWEQEGKDEEDAEWPGMGKRWHSHSMEDDEEDEDEDYDLSRKQRSKHHSTPRDEERWRRYEQRDINGLEYDGGRKRKPSPWRGESDRRSSWESVSWDEEERFPQREYCERRGKAEREDSYWCRREPDIDGRPYTWNRKFVPPDEEYLRSEQPSRRKQERYHRYVRDRSRELAWDDDYSEQGEEDSPRYVGRKQNWPKRPSSASETRRSVEKGSLSDYKSRMLDKQQHSLPSSAQRSERPENIEKMNSYTLAERRYREKMGRRPRSREGHFNSDQEYDYWPQPERSRRPEREISYDQRSQTLHTRRPQRYKKGSDYGYTQKSPFDDDFSMQAFEIGLDSSKSQVTEPDISDTARRKSPSTSSHNITLPPITAFTDTVSKSKDHLSTEPSVNSKNIIVSSPLDLQHSPLPEDSNKAKTPRGSSHRKSPFEDDFTPPETQNIRLPSSISSDISDHRKSPYDDPRHSDKVHNTVDESLSVGIVDQKNGKLSDDVFLPTDVTDLNKIHTEHTFSAFENSPFGDGEFVPSPKTVSESKFSDKKNSATMWNNEESNKLDRYQAGMKLRMTNLIRVDSTSSLKKSESINIFARESGPFDDDFFSTETAASIPRPRSENTSRSDEKSNANNSVGDTFKWTQAFDAFNFDDEK